jgi:hypothetical protein
LEHAQVINQLKAAKLRRALLLKFGARSLQFRRIVYGARNDDPAREPTSSGEEP